MTDLLRPFAGYMPTSEFGRRIVGPPSTTLTPEQRDAAKDDPLSFRYAAGRKAGCSAEDAMRWISARVEEGALARTDRAVVVYRQHAGDFVATGILADVSLDAYRAGRVKRHEKTILKTQEKMVGYMRTTRVFGNPAVTAFGPAPEVEKTIAGLAEGRPDSAFTTVDDIGHELWLVTGDAAEDLCGMLDTELYITDGHHRLAAAAFVAAEEGREDARLPVGVFSAGEFRLRSFARCVTDPELEPGAVVTQLGTEVDLEEVDPNEALPRSRYEFGARIGDRYYRLRIPQGRIPSDHHDSLNTSLLQDLVLGPIFGIIHPRMDKRLGFVAHLDDRVEPCADADAWLLPFPLEADDVIAVAHSDQTMPAKSTWFAPKLPSGLVIRPLDQP